MLRPTAVSVTPHDDYSLTVTFDNGETKRFDVTPYIHGEWYSHLHDKAYFRAARTDGFSVVWPDGQDLCPDELYEKSIP